MVEMQSTTSSRYSDGDLEEFRSLIQLKMEKSKEKLDFYLKQIVDLADNPDAKIKGFDDSVGTAEMERTQELAGMERKYLTNLMNAMIRVDNKTYGICRETGKLIPKERLRIVPHATLCLAAKNKR